MVLMGSFGRGLRQLNQAPDPGTREAFLVVALAWLFAALFGAVPYVLAGTERLGIRSMRYFESMSGFTMTGATVMADISFDTHSRVIL